MSCGPCSETCTSVRAVHGALCVIRHTRWQYVGGQGTQGDGDVSRRASHAIVGVLVCTRPSAASAVGGAEVGVPILYLQG